MITALTLIVGAVIAVTSAGTGWLAGRRAGRAQLAAPAVAAGLACSCGHGFGTHDGGLRCHGTDLRRRNGMQHLDPCPCHRYDGVPPLAQVWDPIALP